MLAQRITQTSARRLLAQQSSIFAYSKFAAPAAIALSNSRIQLRPAATTTASHTDAHSILAAQRLNRPVSPHLGIYRPQITWYLSMLNRITGSVLSGGFYVFGAAYLAAPVLGWHLESASLAAAFGAWPVWAKMMAKFGVAMPFTFHSWNGIRHLVWDTGRELSNKAVQRTGWVVVGITVLSSGILAIV